MDVEQRLISKILLAADLVPVMEAKITTDFFNDDYHREAFGWIREYYNEYGEVPTAKIFKAEFPDYELIRVEEPYQVYIDEVRKRRKFELTYDMVQRAVVHLEEDDTDGVLNVVSAGVRQIGTEVSVLRDINLVENWENRLEDYERLENLEGGLRGVPTGFSSIDKVLSGLQPEQLVTFIAEPKAGKSTLLMQMAISVHEFKKVPLFISFEMSADEQWARHDAMRAGINHHSLITGNLTKKEKKLLRASLKRIRNEQPFFLSTDISSATTISGIQAKIEQYEPDVVFIDGIYLMDDEEGEAKGSAQALTNLTRGMKRLAQKARVPIVCTTQVLTWKFSRRKGLTADAIGYSSSFAQDSDVILGVENMEDEDDLKKVRVVMARSAPKRTILIRWDWKNMDFTEIDDDYDEEEGEGGVDVSF